MEDCFATFTRNVLAAALLKIEVFCYVTSIDTAQCIRKLELLFNVFVEFFFLFFSLLLNAERI